MISKTQGWLQGRGESLKWYCCWELTTGLAVMTFILSQKGCVMLSLKNLLSQRERGEKRKIILFQWCVTLALQVRKHVVSLVSAPAIFGTGSIQDPSSVSPVCLHKALKPQRSLPWAADRSSIQSDGCAVNLRCQGACKHNSFLTHDSSSLCSCQGFWLG